MTANTPFFTIETLRRFSADRKVYRAFDHLVTARMGALLLVPPHLVTGRVEVVDGCPVPWEEVFAVLEYPVRGAMNLAPTGNPIEGLLGLVGLDPLACVIDTIAPLVNGKENVLRLVHPCGVRFAAVMA